MIQTGRGRARLYRDRDDLLVFFVGEVRFGAAAAEYFLADLLVAAAPVVMLASGVTVALFTAYASRRVVGQWGGTGGAICEDHLAFCGELCVMRRLTRLEKPVFYASIRGVHQHRNRNTVYHTLSR